MNNDSHDNELDDDEVESILKELVSEEPDNLHWPDNNAIFAFLRGQANPSQVDEITRAMLSSQKFRREMVTLANELHDAETSSVVIDDNSKYPEIHKYLDKHAAKSPWLQIIEFTQRDAVRYAAAASILLALTATVWFTRGTPLVRSGSARVEVKATNIDASRLILGLKGSSEEKAAASLTADESLVHDAFKAFQQLKIDSRSLLDISGYGFRDEPSSVVFSSESLNVDQNANVTPEVLKDSLGGATEDNGVRNADTYKVGRLVSLILRETRHPDTQRSVFQIEVPALDRTLASELRLWFHFSTTDTVYWIPLTNDTVYADVPIEGDLGSLYFVVTYEDAGQTVVFKTGYALSKESATTE